MRTVRSLEGQVWGAAGAPGFVWPREAEVKEGGGLVQLCTVSRGQC